MIRNNSFILKLDAKLTQRGNEQLSTPSVGLSELLHNGELASNLLRNKLGVVPPARAILPKRH